MVDIIDSTVIKRVFEYSIRHSSDRVSKQLKAPFAQPYVGSVISISNT